MTFPILIRRAEDGSPLSLPEIQLTCELLLDEKNSIEERGDFLAALHARRETPEEIARFVEVLLDRAVKLPFDGAGCIDVCGTGGDKTGFFNISTASMFVAAGAGARVVKHGNRGITSKSGGADVLEALGVRVDLPPDATARALEKAGCCFLFAPSCHPAFQAVAPVRKRLAARGQASIFNIIGPLLNPVRPEFQLAGVFNPDLVKTYAGVFQKLGRTRAWAVHGTGPHGLRLDEVSPLGKTRVAALEMETIREFDMDPGIFGLAHIAPETLLGGDATENAKILLAILDGSEQGPRRQAVQINAAAALVVSGRAKDLQAGWTLAAASLDEGLAMTSLEALRNA
ncbi:MAG: anthranilate phosphoribosyltransferase [bacterium]